MLHGFDALLLFVVNGGDGYLLQGLAHDDLFLLAEREHHGGNLLCQFHARLLFLVYLALVGHGECAQVHALCVSSCGFREVAIETVGIVGCNGSHQLGHGLQTSVEGLIG